MESRRNAERWEYWRGMLAEHRSSGLSVAEFCRKRKLSQASYYTWRNKLASQPREGADWAALPPGSAASAPVFVSLPLADSRSLSARDSDVPPGRNFELTLPNGIRVSVPPQFEPSVLANVLQTATGIESDHA